MHTAARAQQIPRPEAVDDILGTVCRSVYRLRVCAASAGCIQPVFLPGVAYPKPRRFQVRAMSSRVGPDALQEHLPRRRYRARVAFKTARGRSVVGKAEYVLQRPKYKKYLDRQVDLIFTSPPFPLNRKKKYGNEQGEQYVSWLASFAPLFKTVLSPLGSVVLELGNAWEPGRPVMSTLASKGPS